MIKTHKAWNDVLFVHLKVKSSKVIQKFGVSTFIKIKVIVEAYSFSGFFNDLKIQTNKVSFK